MVVIFFSHFCKILFIFICNTGDQVFDLRAAAEANLFKADGLKTLFCKVLYIFFVFLLLFLFFLLKFRKMFF